jgi:hypothetical protein
MVEMAEQAAAAGEARWRAVGAVAVEVAVNIALPFAIYALGKARWGDAGALMISSGPPIAWSIFEFARKRKVDAVSMLVLAGILLSLLAFLGGGGIKALQLREKLVTGLVGLIFLGSAAIGRPLIYYLSRATIVRTSAVKAQAFASLRDNAEFRGAMLTMTLAWGAALVAECAASLALTYLLSVRAFLVVGPVVGYGALGLMTLWTYAFARRRLTPHMHAALEAAGE